MAGQQQFGQQRRWTTSDAVTPDGHIKVRFAPVGEAVADLIEKLAFRRHRRQIAESRQPRRGQG